MMRLSMIFFKIVRRIALPIQNWYRTSNFIAGAKKVGTNLNMRGVVNLWCDNVSVGNDVNIYPNTTFWGQGRITIGNHVEVGIGSVIYSSSDVEIGNNVLIAAHCYIIDSNHGIEKNKLIRDQVSTIKGPVVIEDDVWLGAGCKVLSGVHIGNGAVIGANSLVNKDIPDYAIAVGSPARIIGYRK